MRESHISSMKKALALLQYIAITQLGCGTDKLKERRAPKADATTDYWYGSQHCIVLTTGFGYFFFNTKHNAHRFTFKLTQFEDNDGIKLSLKYT